METINKKKGNITTQALKKSGITKQNSKELEVNKDNRNNNAESSAKKVKPTDSTLLEPRRKKIKEPLNNHLVEEGATFYNDTPYDTLDSTIKIKKAKPKKKIKAQ